MGFTDLFLRKSSGKAISPSQNDEKIVVATTKKIIKALNPTHNGKLMCNVIGSIVQDYIILLSLQFSNSSIQLFHFAI